MTKLNKNPYQFLNESKGEKHILTLSGTIQKRQWADDKYIDAELVSEALDGVRNDITIYLNSNGGDAFQGIEICSYLKNHPSKITVEITGVAASAASFIAAGADEVVMNVGTTIMIHEALTYTWGNKAEIQKTLNKLEVVDESILSIYTEKTGQTAEQITQWMNEEKWFTADEAVKYGFADIVKKETQKQNNENMKAMIKEAVALAMAEYHPPKEEEKPLERSLLNKLRKEVK